MSFNRLPVTKVITGRRVASLLGEFSLEGVTAKLVAPLTGDSEFAARKASEGVDKACFRTSGHALNATATGKSSNRLDTKLIFMEYFDYVIRTE